MSLLSVLLVSIFLSGCGNAQNTERSVTNNVKTNLEQFLPEGTQAIDILGLKENPRLVELHLKMQESLSKNYDWFIEYAKNVPEGKTMPYHPNMGLTEMQYDSILNMKDDIELVPVGTDSINIIRTASTIKFHTEGQLQILNLVVIDLDKNLVIFNKKELSFDKPIHVDDDTNALRSRWKGYSWKLSVPENLSVDMVADRENLNAGRYTFDVGLLESNNRTFIRLKATEIVDGITQMEFEIPLLFQAFD